MNLTIPRLCKRIEELNRIPDFIKKGGLSIYIEDEVLHLIYSNNTVEVKRARPIHGISIKDIQIEIRNFLIDVYYDYEWDGRPLKISELSKIMGMSLSSTHDLLEQIFTKIQMHLEMLK